MSVIIFDKYSMRKFIDIITEAIDLYKRDYHDLVDTQLAAQLQEKGFDTKYLLFHGSSYADLKAFDLRKNRTAAHIYTTPDPRTASAYGNFIYLVVGKQAPQANLTTDSGNWKLIGELAEEFADEFLDTVEYDDIIMDLKSELIAEIQENDPDIDDWDAEQMVKDNERYQNLLRSTAKTHFADMLSGDLYQVSSSLQDRVMHYCFANGYKYVRFDDPSSTGDSQSVVFDVPEDVFIISRLE